MDKSTIIRLLIEEELPEPLFSKELYDTACANQWITQGVPEERLMGVVCSLLGITFKEHPQMVKQYTLNFEASSTVLNFDHRRSSPSMVILMARLLNAITTLQNETMLEAQQFFTNEAKEITDKMSAEDQAKIDRVRMGFPPEEMKYD
jgi:hypothetical protein